MRSAGRVVVIGIDGGSFDYLRPLMDHGHMPNLRSFMDGGFSCCLQSTFPPLTSPAWLSLTSGRNPARLGVYEFVMFDKETRQLHFYNYDRLEPVPEIWDILNMHGLTCTIVNHPLMAKPITVDSYCVPGMLSPDNYSTYPPGLRKELDRLVGGYQIDVRGFNALKAKDLTKAAIRVMEKRARVFKHLLDIHPTDFFLGFLTGSDRVCHSLLNDVDLDTLEGKHADLFIEFFHCLDKHLGDLFASIHDKDHLFIVSDHGFCKTETAFHINQWLHRSGYLSLKNGKSPSSGLTLYKLARVLSRLRLLDVVLRIMPPRMRDMIKRHFRIGSEYAGGRSIVDLISDNCIDWERTSAIATPSGNIYINPQGNPGGSQETVSALTEELGNIFTQESTGRMKLWQGEDLYPCKPSGLSPDIFLDLWEGVKAVSNVDTGNDEIFGTIGRADHTRRGVLLAGGPFIAKGSKELAHIEDFLPSVLHLLGLPIPENIDGSVIMDAFAAGSPPGEAHQQVLSQSSIDRFLCTRSLNRRVKEVAASEGDA